MATYEVTTKSGTYEVETAAGGGDVEQAALAQTSPFATPPTGGSPLGIAEIPGGLARGVVQGGQGMLETGVNIGELSQLNKLLQNPNAPRQFLESSKSGLNELIPPSQSIAGKISEGVGQLPSMVATFENPVAQAVGAVPLAAGLGAINAQQGGAGAMVAGAGSGAAQMALLGKAQELGGLPGAALGAGTMGGAAALSGNNEKDVISQAALGAGFVLATPENIQRIKDNLGKAAEFSKNPVEKLKNFIDLSKEDPVQQFQQQIAEKQKIVQSQQSALSGKLKTAGENLTGRAQEPIVQDQKVIEALKSDEQKRYEAEQEAIKTDRAKTVTMLQSQFDNLLKNVPKTSYERAKYIQENWKSFWGQASDQYGKQLQSTAEKMDNNTIAIGDSATVINSAIKKVVNEYGSGDHPVVKKLFKLLETKYNPDPILFSAADRDVHLSEVSQQQAQLYGKQMGKSFIDKYNEAIAATHPFKEFYRDMKNIIDSQQLGDHAVDLVKKTVGDYIAAKDPTFKQLQSEYSDILSYRESLARTFKPWQGEGALKSGENWLRNFVEGSSSFGYTDKKLLDFLETGYKGKKIDLKGMGDLSGDLKDMGMKIDSFKRSIADSKDKDFGTYAMQLAEAGQNHLNNLAYLDKQKQLSSETLNLIEKKFEQQMASIKEKAEANFDFRKKIYEKARLNTQEIDRNRKRFEGFENAITQGLFATGNWKLGHVLRASVMLRRASRVKGSKI